MDRLLAGGTVNAAESGEGPPLFLFHSLLSDRASFDAIVPELSKSFRVIVPELPGFGRSQAVDGGLAGVADRMAEADIGRVPILRRAAGDEESTVVGLIARRDLLRVRAKVILHEREREKLIRLSGASFGRAR